MQYTFCDNLDILHSSMKYPQTNQFLKTNLYSNIYMLFKLIIIDMIQIQKQQKKQK